MELIVMLKAKTAEELSDKAAAIKSAIQGMNGAQYYEATLPASSRNFFTATLPGWMWSRHRGFTLYGEDCYAADLLPICCSFAGHSGPVESLFQGADGNLVNVVSFLGEGAAATPQNIIIPGAPGVPNLRRGPINNWTDAAGHGAVIAMDPATGEPRWKYRMTDVTDTGVVTTASDLLITGGREGYLQILNARTGALLWKTNLGAQMLNGPITYSVSGRQYIAAMAGLSLFTFALPEQP